MFIDKEECVKRISAVSEMCNDKLTHRITKDDMSVIQDKWDIKLK